MKKKKICYITNSFKNCGPCNVLLSMLIGIDKQKYEVFLLTLLNENDRNYISKVKKYGINIIELNYSKSLLTLLKRKDITDKINDYKFDIVHIHGQITTIIVHKVKAYKVVTVHNKLYEDFRGLYGPIKGYIITKLYINAMKKCDAIVSCSETSYNVCKKYLKNLTYIRNGIWFEKHTKDYVENIRKKIRHDLKIPNDAKVFIFAGRYNCAKNVITMLEFFKKSLKANEFLISLGDGPLFDECKKYNSKNIIQPGFINNVTDYFFASDIYTSFSYTEGLPVSIIEALHCGLLLLLSNIDSHNEILNISNKYKIGESFINNDYDSFEKSKSNILQYKENDSIIFQSEYLSEKTMMNKYEKIYDKFVNDKLKDNML